ncbi:hypothetical protein ACHQM5_008561 [Ranunculus cassubicifolius]
MIKCGLWNVRGINDPFKSREVSKRIRECGLALIGLVETKVAVENFGRISRRCWGTWDSLNNYSACPNGRVWVG